MGPFIDEGPQFLLLLHRGFAGLQQGRLILRFTAQVLELRQPLLHAGRQVLAVSGNIRQVHQALRSIGLLLPEQLHKRLHLFGLLLHQQLSEACQAFGIGAGTRIGGCHRGGDLGGPTTEKRQQILTDRH